MPCRAEIPHLNALVQRFADRGLVVLGINAEPDRARETAAARKLGLGYPVLLGMGKVCQDYMTEGFPYTVLIDRKGAVRARWGGFGEGMEATIARAVEEQLGTSR